MSLFITDVGDNASTNDGNSSNDFKSDLIKEIEELSKRVGEVDVSDCKDANEAAVKRVRVVKTYLDVGKDIRSLESSVSDLKGCLDFKKDDEDEKDIDTDMILKNAKSMKEVTDQVYQFEYEEFKDGGAVICGVCEKVFKYSRDLKVDFTDNGKFAKEFSNLKISLRRHLKSEMHKKKSREIEENDTVKKKEDIRNAAVGVRIGKLVYHLVKLGRPLLHLCGSVHQMLQNWGTRTTASILSPSFQEEVEECPLD